METDTALVLYRRREKVTQADLAARLRIGAPTLCKWEKGRVPAERVLDVERETGISRHELRPDIYGPTAEAAA